MQNERDRWRLTFENIIREVHVMISVGGFDGSIFIMRIRDVNTTTPAHLCVSFFSTWNQSSTKKAQFRVERTYLSFPTQARSSLLTPVTIVLNQVFLLRSMTSFIRVNGSSTAID